MNRWRELLNQELERPKERVAWERPIERPVEALVPPEKAEAPPTLPVLPEDRERLWERVAALGFPRLAVRKGWMVGPGRETWDRFVRSARAEWVADAVAAVEGLRC